MGVLYARAGLLDDARRELEALRNANPDSSIAAELLRQIKAARPPS
jgi:predicted Zn-dependent protease